MNTNERKNVSKNSIKRCVYTVLIGDYEDLNYQPAFEKSDIDWICFTDNSTLKSDCWKISLVDRRIPDDQIRSARYLKIMGPEILHDYDESLYIDNSVILSVLPEKLIEDGLSHSDFSLPLHSFRETVSDEFDEVNEIGLDDPSRVSEQRAAYARVLTRVLDEKPYWTAILARRHSEHVKETMRLWYEQVLRYSRRDQLSINFALLVSKLNVNAVAIDNFESYAHKWPITPDRKEFIKRTYFLDEQIATLNQSMTQRGEQIATLNQSMTQRDEQIAALNQSMTQRDEQIAALNQSMSQRDEQIISLKNWANLIVNSASWKLTRPIRFVGSQMRRIKQSIRIFF